MTHAVAAAVTNGSAVLTKVFMRIAPLELRTGGASQVPTQDAGNTDPAGHPPGAGRFENGHRGTAGLFVCRIKEV